ncbi:thiamine pyrophosphate-dependent enzyme [Prosthecobacter sp.]|uniref:thiamine pyrophosphate-dependent enzyme n=1 Tax=Prosthecobacter sp. TaxID=1965333 RepID=UPI0037843A84
MAFESFAQQFTKLGGTRVFGVPGGGPSLELITQIENDGGSFLATGHEAVAALMAGAHARQTGAPAACVTIKGPGFMNLSPGLLCNSYEGYPCLSISEAYPPDESTGRRHKWLNHLDVASTFLRGFHGFSEIGGTVETLWAEATQECPGPVHMELVPRAETVNELPRAMQAATQPDWRKQIAAASCPALLIGTWATRAPWRAQLASLNIPVFTTAAAKGALSEHLPQSAGICTGDGKPGTPEKVLLPQADLLICLGVRSGEMLSPSAPHANTLWVDAPGLHENRVFPDNVFGTRASALTDAEATELFAALQEKNWGLEAIAAAHAHLQDAMSGWEDSPLAAMRTASQRLPGAAHIVDTGNFTVWSEHFLRVEHHLDLTGTPNGRYLGAGLGYALGTAFARAPKPSVLWIGDGGIRANLAELSLAVDHKLPLLVLVMRDGYLGSIRGRARKLGWSQQPLTLPDHRLLRVAEAMGLATWDAPNASALDAVIQQWQRAGNPPALIEYHLAPDIYVDMTEQLR